MHIISYLKIILSRRALQNTGFMTEGFTRPRSRRRYSLSVRYSFPSYRIVCPIAPHPVPMPPPDPCTRRPARRSSDRPKQTDEGTGRRGRGRKKCGCLRRRKTQPMPDFKPPESWESQLGADTGGQARRTRWPTKRTENCLTNRNPTLPGTGEYEGALRIHRFARVFGRRCPDAGRAR